MRPELATPVEDRVRDRFLIDELLSRYVDVVDGQRWHEWPDLFTADGAYAVYALDNVEDGLPLAYMLDDNANRLRDRVKFVTEVWAGTIEPYRTRHFLQVTNVDQEGRTYRVRSNLLVTYAEIDELPGTLATGFAEDTIRFEQDAPRLASRAVHLDGTPGRYLVYPL